MDDVIRQRIKYLVEHGELYPASDAQSEHKKIWLAISALTALQFIELVVDLLR